MLQAQIGTIQYCTAGVERSGLNTRHDTTQERTLHVKQKAITENKLPDEYESVNSKMIQYFIAVAA